MTPDKKDFLKEYCPKDNMFTSKEEVKLVTDALGLEDMSIEELCQTRDKVVLFYLVLEDEEYKENGITDKLYSYMTAMQSVTTVIDEEEINRGRFDIV